MPESIQCGDLERDDLPVLFFRASFELGFAIEKHRKNLSDALSVQNKSVFEFLSEKSRHWIDNYVGAFAGLDYSGHLEVICNHIRSDIGPGISNQLRLILCSLVGELTGQQPKALAELLQAINKDAYGLASKALEKFGNNAAKDQWRKCRLASLRFNFFQDNFTYTIFESNGNQNTISIRIGNHVDSASNPKKGALRTFYNMPFYFFHEYISHSFCKWQNALFVEGFLLWAEKEMFEKCGLDLVVNKFIADIFPASTAYQTAESAAKWFNAVTDGRYLQFLLCWAADDGYEIEEADLTAMINLANKLNFRSMDDIRNIQQCFAKEAGEIRADLRRWSRNLSGVSNFTSVLL